MVAERTGSTQSGLFPRRAKSETTLLSAHLEATGRPGRRSDAPVQTVLQTVEIPQEQFLESFSGVHHQMPEDPKVLEIAGVLQVQLIDKVADVSV